MKQRDNRDVFHLYVADPGFIPGTLYESLSPTMTNAKEKCQEYAVSTSKCYSKITITKNIPSNKIPGLYGCTVVFYQLIVLFLIEKKQEQTM